MNGQRTLPGGVALWVFIFADLLLFGLYLALAAWDGGAIVGAYPQAKTGLDPTLGMINTVVLLTGSWAVAMGTRVVGDARIASRYVLLAAGTGLAFLAVKLVEYSHHVAAGHTIASNRFFTWYWFLTGFHALHVIAAVVLLVALAGRMRKGPPPGEIFTEAAGCYWHLVDLLWIGIFLVLYLL